MPNQSAGLGDDFMESNGLLNVERVALPELLTSDESALVIALRRVIVESEDGENNFAAFGNTP